MANQPNRFAALMERVAQGDEQAAKELFDQYHKAILIVIRQRLGAYPKLRALYDSIDFLQEAWKEVFSHPDKLREFTTFKPLLKFLAATACHKVEKVRRKLATQKRDRRRVRHLGDPDVATAAAAVADPRPGPDKRMVLDDEWKRWFLSLSERQRQVVLMLRNGYTYLEIAAELDCSVRSIERMVAQLRDMPPPVPLPYL